MGRIHPVVLSLPVQIAAASAHLTREAMPSTGMFSYSDLGSSAVLYGSWGLSLQFCTPGPALKTYLDRRCGHEKMPQEDADAVYHLLDHAMGLPVLGLAAASGVSTTEDLLPSAMCYMPRQKSRAPFFRRVDWTRRQTPQAAALLAGLPDEDLLQVFVIHPHVSAVHHSRLAAFKALPDEIRLWRDLHRIEHDLAPLIIA